jgi:hypothetical protein
MSKKKKRRKETFVTFELFSSLTVAAEHRNFDKKTGSCLQNGPKQVIWALQMSFFFFFNRFLNSNWHPHLAYTTCDTHTPHIMPQRLLHLAYTTSDPHTCFQPSHTHYQAPPTAVFNHPSHYPVPHVCFFNLSLFFVFYSLMRV